MIHHQIRLAMRPDAPQDKVEEALGMLRRMGREIDAVAYWAVGRDVGGDFDYGAMFAVQDIAAYRAYMLAPLHRRVDEIGLPLVRHMVSHDLTDDEDPATGELIRQIHAERFAGDPALVALIEGLGSYQGSSAPGRDQGSAPEVL
ncbi:Dabb family protein [Streptomyces sp. NPDC005549]|uniref:Dabb family protein n=1 Tax=Streptomyces sp. NPDC005549 TaxID=3154888 RepID=UPI0033A5BD38